MNLSDRISKEKMLINRKKRERLNGHRSFVIWFTGLSGAGKSTVSKILELKLHDLSLRTMLLDGDNIRHGINNDLTFSADDRKENIRRVAEICKMFNDAGVITLASLISPYKCDREMAQEIIGKSDFIEIFVNVPLSVCIDRDTKGLYKKALNGIISDFTGIDSPYEAPNQPAVVLNTAEEDIEECVLKILDFFKSNRYINE